MNRKMLQLNVVYLNEITLHVTHKRFVKRNELQANNRDYYTDKDRNQIRPKTFDIHACIVFSTADIRTFILKVNHEGRKEGGMDAT